MNDRINKQTNRDHNFIFIYLSLLSLSVCLYVCVIITQEPLDRFASNFDLGTREIHGNVLILVLGF